MERLEKLFYNPEFGLTNSNNLYKIANEQGLNLSHKQITDWYKMQSVNQLYYPQVKRYIPISCPFGSVGCLQIDLQDVSKFFRENGGTHYLFNAIDIFSRYLWSYPIKNKQATSTVEPMKKIIEQIKEKYPQNMITITCDKGSEFAGAFKKYLDSQNIRIFLNDPDSVKSKTVMSVVERVNRTIWGFIKKYTTYKNTLTFVDQIPNFVKNYNNTIHSTIKMKPVDVFNGVRIPINNLHDKVSKSKIKINDFVRTIIKGKLFDKKSFLPKWSEQVYQIVNKIGNTYQIKNIKTDQLMKKLFIERELQKINYVDQPEINIQEKINDNNKINKFVNLQQHENIGDVDKVTGDIIIPEKLQKKSDTKLRPKKKVDQPVEYEVEAIVDQYTGEDNKQYYEVKWLGYDSSENTTETFQTIKNTEAYKIWKKNK